MLPGNTGNNLIWNGLFSHEENHNWFRCSASWILETWEFPTHLIWKMDWAMLIQSFIQQVVPRDTWKNGNLNLNFRHQFDSTGGKISAILIIPNTHHITNRHLQTRRSLPSGWKKVRQTLLVISLLISVSIRQRWTTANPLKKISNWKLAWNQVMSILIMPRIIITLRMVSLRLTIKKPTGFYIKKILTQLTNLNR